MSNQIEGKDFVNEPDVRETLASVQKSLEDTERASKDFQDALVKGLSRLDSVLKNLNASVKTQQQTLQKLDSSNRQHRKEAQEIFKTISDNVQAFDKYAQTQRNTKKAQDAVKGSVAELKEQYKSIKKEAENLNVETDEGASRFKELAKQAVNLKSQINDFNTSLRASNNVINLVEGSYNALTQENKQLRKEMNNLNPNIKEQADRLRQLQKAYNENNNKLKEFDKELGQHFRNVGNYKSALDGVTGALKNVGAGLAATFIATSASDIAKDIAQMTVEINKFNNSLQQLSGLQGKDLDDLSASVRAVASTFGEDMNEVLQATNALSQQMGISQTEAIDLIEKGFIKGANANNNFLEKVKEYPIQFKNAGLSAEDFIKTATQEARGGIFGDKLLDTVKEVGLRLRELPKASLEAIKPLGDAFSKELVKDLETGAIKSDEAFKRILERTQELGLTTKQTQEIVSNLGGGALEDLGGLEFAIKNLTEAQNLNLKVSFEYEKQQERRLELDKQVAEAQGELAEQLTGFTNATGELFTQVQILVLQGLTEFIKALKAIPEFLEENSTEITLFAIALTAMNAQFIASRVSMIATTVATKAYTVATNLATKAVNFFKNALKTNPFGLLIAGATTAIGLLTIFNKKQSEVEKAGEEATKGLQKENVEFNLQIEKLKSLKPESEARSKLITEINKKYKDYLPNLLDEKANLDDIKNAQKAANEQFEKRIRLMSLEAQVAKTIDVIADLELKKKQASKNLNEQLTETGFNLVTAQRIWTGELGNTANTINASSSEVKEYKDLLKDLEKDLQQAKLDLEVNTSGKTPEEVAKEEKKKAEAAKKASEEVAKAQAKSSEELAKKLQKNAEDLATSLFELQKWRLENQIEINERLIENEDSSEEQKLKVIEDNAQKRLDLAQLEFDRQEKLIKASEKSAKAQQNELTLLREQQASKEEEIEREKQDKLQSIRDEAAQTRLQREQETLDAAVELVETTFEQELARVDEEYAKRLTEINNETLKLLTDGTELTEQAYTKILEDAEEARTQEAEEQELRRLEIAKEALKIKLGIDTLPLEQKKKIEQEITEIERQESEKRLEISKREREQKIKDQKEVFEKISEVIGQIGTVFSDVTSAVGDLLSQQTENRIEDFDKQLEELETLKEKRLEDVENSTESEEEKAQAKAFIEEKFAKKQDELNEKKRQEQIKQFNREKAISIGETVINTATGIVKTIAQLGLPFALPFVAIAGAIGATQLATISSQKPKFKDGTERVLGPGTRTSDSIDARLSKDERIVDADTNEAIGFDFPNDKLPDAVRAYNRMKDARMMTVAPALDIIRKHQYLFELENRGVERRLETLTNEVSSLKKEFRRGSKFEKENAIANYRTSKVLQKMQKKQGTEKYKF